MTIRLDGESHHAMIKRGSSSWLLCVTLDVGPVCVTPEAARAIGLRFDLATPDEHATLARLGFLGR
jgi:hypothetical protein